MKFTLVLTVCLVILVIFLFLRNVSATIIPSLALPLSLMGTFACMLFLGFSLNNISLMALTLAVGFVVDDAIVMLENIVRHMELGKPPLLAAQEGSREVSFTILSMTVSLTAVFIPVLFMGGVVGRLFKEFAVTICVAILFSGFVSLSLTPMLCSRWLKPGHGETHGRFYLFMERLFDGHAAPLRTRPDLGHRPPPADHGLLRGAAPGHGLAVHGHAQGIFAQRGHRPARGRGGGRAGHQLRGHERQAEAGDGHHLRRRERGGIHVRGGRRRPPSPP